MWNHRNVEQVECAEQAGNVRWGKQWRILCCYHEDVDENLEQCELKEEPPIDDEIQPIKTFGESESATDFKGFEALHINVLDIKDQLLYFDVQMEVEHMYDELRWSLEMFQQNIYKLTLNVKRKKIHAYAANDFAWYVQTIKYEP